MDLPSFVFLGDIFSKKYIFIAVKFVVNNSKGIDYISFSKTIKKYLTMKMQAHVTFRNCN